MISIKSISFLLILFVLNCEKKSLGRKSFEETEVYLPTEKQISKVLHSKEDYRMLDDFAKSIGYRNLKEYHTKIVSEISDEEFQMYYNEYKTNGLESLGIEALANERKKIMERIAWYKVIKAANLKVEVKNLEFTKVDWKRISLDEEPIIGNQFAKVTVIEYSDFACHYCSKSQFVSQQLREKYGKKIYWVFKDFPLQDIHEDAFQAHVSANCVKQIQPEKYWSHFKLLFKNYRSLEKDFLLSYVEESGVDGQKWESCMKNPALQKKIISEIQADIKEGKKLGIKGTPTFIINGNLVVGARGYEFFDAVIDKELKASPTN